LLIFHPLQVILIKDAKTTMDASQPHKGTKTLSRKQVGSDYRLLGWTIAKGAHSGVAIKGSKSGSELLFSLKMVLTSADLVPS
jgi:hypothetical protein